MATTFNTPGVYIQEIPKLPASVAQVATAVPAFMGYTAINPLVPVRITSMLEFEQNFGGPQKAVTFKKVTGNYQTTVVSARSNLYYSLQLYFANGGGPCYVVSTGVFFDTGFGNIDDFGDALAMIRLEDEPTLLVAPDSQLLSGTNPEVFMIDCLEQCATLQDRFTIMDVTDSSTIFRGSIGTNNLKYGAAYYPNLLTTFTYPDSAVVFGTGLGSVNLPAPPGGTANLNGMTLAEALLDPIISPLLLPILPTVRIEIAKLAIIVPPSGAIAGIYASVDASRGVWKAPANVSINSVVGPVEKITDAAQDGLNIDPTGGKSINAIRTFTGKGTLVWGARTLAGNDNEWKYVNVRRLFITAEESIKKATAFVVFEPNDANTWVRTKAMIENYLTGLWRDGALAGATPQEAFFVNVGLGITMTSDDILKGILNIEVGMAAVRPAEFIILNFSHKLQTS